MVAVAASERLPERDHRCCSSGGKRLGNLAQMAGLHLRIVPRVGDDDAEADVRQAVERLVEEGANGLLAIQQVADGGVPAAKLGVIGILAIAVNAGQMAGWQDDAPQSLREPQANRVGFQAVQSPRQVAAMLL